MSYRRSSRTRNRLQAAIEQLESRQLLSASYTVTTGPVNINENAAVKYTVSLVAGVNAPSPVNVSVTGGGYFDYSNSTNITATNLTIDNANPSASFYFTATTPGAYTSLNFTNTGGLTDPAAYPVWVNDLQNTGGFGVYQTIANGNWSSPSTWQGGNVPGLTATTNNACVLIYNNVTLDQSATLGTSPYVETCLTLGDGYHLTVNSGVTLTLRGNAIQYGGIGENNTTTFNSGSSLVFDSSQLLTPTTNLAFTTGSGYDDDGVRLAFNGTSAAPVTVSSVVGSGSGVFASNTNGGGFMSATYTNFRNVGDSTHLAFNPNYTYNAGNFSLTNCTFTNCGEITPVSSDNSPGAVSVGNGNFVINNDIFTSSQGANSVRFDENTGNTGGTWSIQNDNSDKTFNIVHSTGLTQSGNTTGNVTGVTISGPTNGPLSAATTLTFALNNANNLPAGVTVTPYLISGSGTFSGGVTLTNTTRSATFTFTPAAGSGPAVIGTTNNGNMVNITPYAFTPNANTIVASVEPTVGTVGAATGVFTVTLGPTGDYSSGVTFTPATTGGGTFSPTSVTLTTASPTASFTYTPTSTGTKTITFSNSAGLTNPTSDSVVVSAATSAPTSFTLSGPANGTIESASSNFTVTLGSGTVLGSDVFTPSALNSDGYFTPASITLNNAVRTGTFTYTPIVYGARTITVNDNVGLTAHATSFVGLVQTGESGTGPTGVKAPDTTGFNFFANGYMQNFAQNALTMTVDPNSASVISTLQSIVTDFNDGIYSENSEGDSSGHDNAQYGYATNIVPATQPLVNYIGPGGVQMGPEPIPSNATIEGYYSATLPQTTSDSTGSDQHLLVESRNDTTGGIQYIQEGQVSYENGSEGAEWVVTDSLFNVDIAGGTQLTDGNGTASRTGVPLTPLFIDYSQVAHAESLDNHMGMGHVLEYTVPNAWIVNNVYVYPAKSGEYLGQSQQNSGLDYGSVMRLSSAWYNANAANYTGQARVVIDTLYHYGMMLTDGSPSGDHGIDLKATADQRWDTGNLNQLNALAPTDFQLTTETPELTVTGPTHGVVGQPYVFNWARTTYPVPLQNSGWRDYPGVVAGSGNGSISAPGYIDINDTHQSGTYTLTPSSAGEMTLTQTTTSLQWLMSVPTSFTALPTDEVGDWNLNEGSGTTAADWSTHNATGTLSSSAAWSANGVNGPAVYFNGSSSITASAASLPQGDAARTVSLMLNTSNLSGPSGTLETLFSYGTIADSQLFVIYAFNNNGTWVGRVGFYDYFLNGSIALTPNAWNHIAVTFDGTNATIYINGVADDTGTFSTVNTTGGAVYMGELLNSATDYFTGALNDVQVYNDVWSATAIASQASAETLVGHWPMTEGTGNANDTSGFHNTISIGASATWSANGIDGGSALYIGNTAPYPYLSPQNDNLLPGGNSPRTVSFWFNTSSLGTNSTYGLISYGGPTEYLAHDNDAFDIQLSRSGTNYVLQWSSEGTTVTGSIALAASAWNHLAVTYDGTNITLYVNGVKDTSSAVPTLTTATSGQQSQLFINDLFGGTDTSLGLYDDLRIYDVALPATSGVIDTFASADSANYTSYLAYSSTRSASTFTVGTNGTATVLEPTAGTSGTGDGTTYFLATNNPADTMKAAGGDTVSIQIVSLPATNESAIGLAFTNSLTNGGLDGTGHSINPSFTLAVGYNAGIYFLKDYGVVLGDLTGFAPSSSNPATLIATRELGANSTIFQYSLSGGGLSSPMTGTVTAPTGFTTATPVYFGPMTYVTTAGQGDEATNLIFDPIV